MSTDRAIVTLCTSVGPSAMPMTGAIVHMPMSGISFDVPSEPCRCSAVYTTSCSTFGVSTFTTAISVRAFVPPTWSIFHAACRTSSRNDSSWM